MGPDDSRVFPLKEDLVRIGRIDPEKKEGCRPGIDVAVGEGYTAVTRISRPHGRFLKKDGAWFIEDCGSTGGTQVNTKKVEKGSPGPLHDGDLIELAKGVSGVRFVMLMPVRYQ